jgi:NTP pyrophosphatase (non-canonical NTP hydrolase)
VNTPQDIAELALRLRKFARDRDWDQFHNPKNLSISIAIEAAELLEMFQWLTAEDAAMLLTDAKDRVRLEEEVADVFIYLVRLADIAEIDLLSTAAMKLEKNEQKYPVEKAYGSAKKYTDLDQ